MITSIFLDGTELTSANRFVQSIRNGAFSDIDFSDTKRGGFEGRTISPGKFISYKFVIEWVIVGSSFSDLATQRENFVKLLAAVVSAGGKTLKINKANGVNVQIEIKGIDVLSDVATSDPLNSRILTEMQAEYPFLRSQTETINTAFIFSGGGMPIPMPIPMDMSAGGSNELIVFHGGNYPAYPVFRFSGPLSNPSLNNLTTGKILNVNVSLVDAGDILEVDIFLRSAIKVPAGTNVRQFITGDFWTLAVGNNNIHLGNPSFNAVGKCIITFRDTYAGI